MDLAAGPYSDNQIYAYYKEKWLGTKLLAVRRHKQLCGSHSVLGSLREDRSGTDKGSMLLFDCSPFLAVIKKPYLYFDILFLQKSMHN